MIFKNRKLQNALENHDTKKAKACVKAGATLDPSWASTFLHNKINCFSLTGIKTYVESGLDIDIILSQSTKRTMLHTAVIAQSHEIAGYLIDSNANVNASDVFGNSILYDTTNEDNDNINTAKIITKLVENGAEIDYQGNVIDKTALMQATSNENEHAVRTLMHLGADLTLKNEEYETAWDYSFYKTRPLFPEYQAILKKEAKEKKLQKEQINTGKWSPCFDKSIACVQLSKEIKTELKQIFNFSAQEVTKIIRNTETNFESHSSQLFAEYADKDKLRTACIEYNKTDNTPVNPDEIVNLTIKKIDGKTTNKSKLTIIK